jgi:hypothetical protein
MKNTIKCAHGKMMISLAINIFREDDLFVADCPALGLTTHGSSVDDAHDKFVELLGVWMESVNAMGTMEQALRELGWRKERKSECLLPKRAAFDRAPVKMIAQEYIPMEAPCFA